MFRLAILISVIGNALSWRLFHGRQQPAGLIQWQQQCKNVAAAVLVSSLLPGLALAADYQPATPPPSAVRVAPKAVQPGSVLKLSYSTFLDEVENNKVEKVTFSPDGKKAVGVDEDGDRFSVDIPNDPNLLSFLVQHKVEINVAPINNNGVAGGLGGAGDSGNVFIPDTDTAKLLQTFVIPAALSGAAILFPYSKLLLPSKNDLDDKKRQSTRGPNLFGGGGGGPGGPSRFGGRGPGGLDPEAFAKSKAKIDLTPVTNTKFSDVAGCDSAKIELEEVVDFLKAPDRYTAMGASVPRGVLLNGPPGTGKTLLARAVAGEAGVPFISVSGSEFVQVFVGVGAARVRDMFRQARENAPCIVFIDEIDAVGRQRGSGGSNDEREQTLNQLLVEMDGFDGNGGVIVMGATNRIDILDEALLRPGRFDRKVEVSLPDYKGRIEILKVHSRNKPLAPDIDLEQVARRTPGLSGASLQNLMNEAAIHAARTEKEIIDWDDVDWAIDRVTVGLEKSNKDALVSDLEIVAFHEAGHAIVGGLMPEYDVVTKISITPRTSGAGGLTFFSPLEDRLERLYTRHYLESQLAVAWGGRVAEEIVFGATKITTGASGDLQQIFRISRAMVTELGMSRLPPLNYDFQSRGDGDIDWPLSTWLKERINSEIIRLASNGYYTAKKILLENEDLLWELARRLVLDDQVSQEEFHFMLYEYKAKTLPYSLYGDTKVDEMPYQVDSDSIADELYQLLPKFSDFLPSDTETAGSTAKSMLPTIRSGYETAEVDALGMMRKENPLLDEDWGRSKMEVLSEAQKIRAEEDRKARLLQLLGGYEKESALRNELRSQTRLREKAVEKLLSTVA
jgi:cell division protease FtsH